MKKIFSTAFAVVAALGFSSCNDFLNQQPEDKLIPETFFNNPSNLLAYTLNFYTVFPNHANNLYQLGTFSSDNGTDNQVFRTIGSMFVPGEWRVGNGTDNWEFGNIRSMNYFIANTEAAIAAGTVSGSETLINQALGEGYFFRAYSYWQYYSAVGDYPITDEVLPDDMEVLLEASKRQPRNKVARHILADLEKAIQYLPESSSYGKNGLSKDAARLFRSRVALFEGTWLKSHKGTALVPGGPGWPGDASMLDGFNIDTEISYFLTEAMTSAKVVGDKFVNNLVQNTDAPEGMTSGFTEANPYYCMFSAVDPSKYSEVLLYRGFSISQNVATQIQAQFQKNAGGTGWTRGMVNSFLMRNGLPIYAAGSGYDPAWEDQGVTATIQDRDSRLMIFTKGDNSVITLGLDGVSPALYNMNWMFSADNNTRCPTGYAVKKGQGYDYKEAQGNLQSVTASIVFRASEALLNYMEACVELNGNVDGTAESYWKALRRRAYVDEDYTKTVAATVMSEEAKGDWGAYTQGSLVSPLLYNVRRERRNELCAEGLRMLDLRRWCAMDQLIANPYQIEGIKYWGTVYNDPESPLAIKNSDGVYIAPVVDENGSNGNMSPKANSHYVRPFQISRAENLVWDGLKFTRAHYLSPIGYTAFVNAAVNRDDVSTSVIYQNPGWPVESGEGAFEIK
ncbi:MAG: RagB/SusD family nutrient uptake outer membrane protein [Paramuribaculum sp.]|nr:RagB/SusD family nutrient uptake outer membrane protein [Paramuribaculum sp.]